MSVTLDPSQIYYCFRKYHDLQKKIKNHREYKREERESMEDEAGYIFLRLRDRCIIRPDIPLDSQEEVV